MPAADPFPVLCLLQSYLEARSDGGEKRLWLTAEAREALREIVRMKPRPWSAERLAEAAAEAEVANGEPAVAGNYKAEEVRVESAAAVEEEDKPEAETVELPAAEEDKSEELEAETAAAEEYDKPEAEADQEEVETEEPWPSLAEDPVSGPPLASKGERLAAVRALAELGREARALGTLRDRMVFAVGSPDAEIVFVGEAPGAEEERQGEPFVGPAGQLLTKIITVMGLSREAVYISNICKYRPEMENQGSKNRQPTAPEMASCMEFVREEIRIIQPKVIVALGATAAAGLLGIRTGVMSARGRFYEFEGIPAMVTLHPSYLLHREKDGSEIANAEKRKVWEDMLQVMERAGLPVSDKQRRFFLPR